MKTFKLLINIILIEFMMFGSTLQLVLADNTASQINSQNKQQNKLSPQELAKKEKKKQDSLNQRQKTGESSRNLNLKRRKKSAENRQKKLDFLDSIVINKKNESLLKNLPEPVTDFFETQINQ